jgi:hypothetical protein
MHRAIDMDHWNHEAILALQFRISIDENLVDRYLYTDLIGYSFHLFTGDFTEVATISGEKSDLLHDSSLLSQNFPTFPSVVALSSQDKSRR